MDKKVEWSLMGSKRRAFVELSRAIKATRK